MGKMNNSEKEKIYEETKDQLSQYLDDNQDIPKHLLYHYTNYEGLKGILESKHLWMTSHKDLNDPSEMNHGFYIIQITMEHFLLSNKDRFSGQQIDNILNFIKTVKENCNIFMVSFCKKEDYLPAWRYYASNCAGYSIGFKKEFFQPRLTSDPNENCKVLSFQLIYHFNEAKKFLHPMYEIFIENLKTDGSNFMEMANHLFTKLFVTLPKFKNPNFQDEHEWRLVTFDFEYPKGRHYPDPNFPEKVKCNQCSTPYNIKYLKNSRKIIHYRPDCIPFAYSDISSIYIGPRLDFICARNDIVKILKENGANDREIDGIEISSSEKLFM